MNSLNNSMSGAKKMTGAIALAAATAGLIAASAMAGAPNLNHAAPIKPDLAIDYVPPAGPIGGTDPVAVDHEPMAAASGRGFNTVEAVMIMELEQSGAVSNEEISRAIGDWLLRLYEATPQ